MRSWSQVKRDLAAEWHDMSFGLKCYEVFLFTAYVLIAIFVLQLVGCATIEEKTGAAPYFEAGVGYQIDANSDWYVSTDRDWQCSTNLQGRFSVGLDWGATELEYFHQSWVACGGPFNTRSELYQDSINLTHRFGGKK